MNDSSLGDDIRAAAQAVVSERLPVGRDRAWGVLSAVSETARKRTQGPHILLALEEHVLGRGVKDPHFAFDTINISGRHCKIYRKSVASEEELAVFVKDSSSNGTFVNGRKLAKECEERIRNEDVLSFAGPPQQDIFVYVYRDVPALKRKALGADDGDTKKPKVSDQNLANVRLLERSNQELRKELEEKRNQNESLTAELRASHTLAESRIKEATDNLAGRHSEEMLNLQEQLSVRSKELDECSAKCVQLLTEIDDLKKRLQTVTQSRLEAEEALRIHKASRVELEQKLEEERLKWKREREETEASHNAAFEKLRADTAAELDRRVEAFTRRIQQMEREIQALQETKREDRAQIESLRTRLEEERESRMNYDKRAQELQIQLDGERNQSASLREDLKKAYEKLEEAFREKEGYKAGKEKAEEDVRAMKVEVRHTMNRLEREQQRLAGAKERILLRETQIKAFHATAEEIRTLQNKQQAQLQSMMQALEDEVEYEEDAVNNAVENLKAIDVAAVGTDATPQGGDEVDGRDQCVADTQSDDTQIPDCDGDGRPTPTRMLDVNEGAPEAGEEGTSRYEVTQVILATQLVVAMDVQHNNVNDEATQQPPETQLMVTPPASPRAGVVVTAATERRQVQEEEPGGQAAAQGEARREEAESSSLHTSDLLTSESASWMYEPLPDEQERAFAEMMRDAGFYPETDEDEQQVRQENEEEVRQASQVATSDSQTGTVEVPPQLPELPAGNAGEGTVDLVMSSQTGNGRRRRRRRQRGDQD